MADLQNILNKFTELGIENKGLVVDDPMQQSRALKESSNNNNTDPNAHARMVAESIKGAHIPGVSDVSSSDMAALAGVAKPQQRPQPANPNPTLTVSPTENYSDRWHEVDARLSNIESKLSSIVESIQKITEMTDSDYNAKRKAIYDLEMNPALQDKESKDAIKQRKAQLEKQRKQTTKESLEKGFASFLKELEG